MYIPNLYQLLGTLIQANDTAHIERIDTLKSPANKPIVYTWKYRTIKLSLGEGVGVSTMIAKEAYANDAIIVSDIQAVQQYRSMGATATIFRLPELLHPVNIAYERVWVDQPSKVFTYTSPRLLYEMFAKNNDQMFLLLGD